MYFLTFWLKSSSAHNAPTELLQGCIAANCQTCRFYVLSSTASGEVQMLQSIITGAVTLCITCCTLDDNRRRWLGCEDQVHCLNTCISLSPFILVIILLMLFIAFNTSCHPCHSTLFKQCTFAFLVIHWWKYQATEISEQVLASDVKRCLHYPATQVFTTVTLRYCTQHLLRTQCTKCTWH